VNGTQLPLRVMVHESWDEIAMTVPDTTTVQELKRRALTAARVTDAAADFLVKFRGAELGDESRSMATVGVPADGALIVLRRRRRPVR
jgi:hypothetical protein